MQLVWKMLAGQKLPIWYSSKDRREIDRAVTITIFLNTPYRLNAVRNQARTLSTASYGGHNDSGMCTKGGRERERSTKESLACYTDTEILYGAACRPRNRIQGLISDSPSRWFSPGLV